MNSSKEYEKEFPKKKKPNFKKVKLELGQSDIDGVGVFAVLHIKKGEYVAEGIHASDYGTLVPWAYFDHLNDALRRKICDFCIGTPKGFFPPDEYDFNKLSVEWFFNHSCSGNLGFDKKGNFIAIRDIKFGEEMTYDYALAESNPHFKMKCKCGGNNCRSIITGNDWKDEKFLNRNRKYILPYLLKISER